MHAVLKFSSSDHECNYLLNCSFRILLLGKILKYGGLTHLKNRGCIHYRFWNHCQKQQSDHKHKLERGWIFYYLWANCKSSLQLFFNPINNFLVFLSCETFCAWQATRHCSVQSGDLNYQFWTYENSIVMGNIKLKLRLPWH